MPTDLVRRVNLDLLHPEFREIALDVTAACRTRGADFFWISGYRSPAEQAALYFQGRTTPGVIVTNAKPWESAHQYGIALDLCRDADATRKGLQPDWKIEDYEILREVAEAHGLESGLSWKSFREGPHIQLPISKKHVSLGMLRARMEKTGKLESAWFLLDQEGPWRAPVPVA